MSNSPEVIKFMQLFQKLKDWSDDDPESLPELASGDESIKDLCLNLLKAAGNLQRNERGNRELFTSPVDPKFVTAWREFERRFGHALLVVRSNAVEAGESNLIFSFDWYEQPADWKDADFDAADTVRAIEGMIDFAIDFARSQADRDTGEASIDWTPVNPEALSKDQKAAWTKFREAQAALGVEYDRLAELMRSGDENTRRELAELTQEFRKEFFGDDPQKLVEWAISHWKKLKDEVGFDLRGVFRRRALVPFILFPRHVAARHGQTEMLSIYQNLRQAHEAFVFGTPFAALSLMRSLMEIVLRDHYGADGATLAERIDKSRNMLPREASASALHRLRRTANAILHLDTKKDEPLPKLEPAQMELEILWLLRVLRALIEGVPQWRSR